MPHLWSLLEQAPALDLLVFCPTLTYPAPCEFWCFWQSQILARYTEIHMWYVVLIFWLKVGGAGYSCLRPPLLLNKGPLIELSTNQNLLTKSNLRVNRVLLKKTIRIGGMLVILFVLAPAKQLVNKLIIINRSWTCVHTDWRISVLI